MVATVFLLASTISGLSRTLDKAWPAPTMINGPQETLPMGAITLAAAEAARALPSGSRIAAAECRQIDGEAWWQFILQAPQPIPCPPGQFGPPLLVQPEPVYVHAQTGVVAPPGFDEVYAKELAATVLGTPGQLDQHLLGFSPQYAVIHRLRPVYQISGADGSSQTAFVSTHAGAVSEWLDVRRKIDKAFFSLFHKYFFVRDRTVREAFQVGVNCLMLAMAGSGLWLWWRLRHLPPGPRTVRRLHRRVGLVAFLAVALGAGSGVLHTTMIFLADAPPPPRPALPPPVTEATAVPPVPAGTVALAVVAVDETAVYQARFAGSPVPEYFDAMYGKVIDGGERQLARSIAEQALGPDPIWLKRKPLMWTMVGLINSCPFQLGAQLLREQGKKETMIARCMFRPSPAVLPEARPAGTARKYDCSTGSTRSAGCRNPYVPWYWCCWQLQFLLRQDLESYCFSRVFSVGARRQMHRLSIKEQALHWLAPHPTNETFNIAITFRLPRRNVIAMFNTKSLNHRAKPCGLGLPTHRQNQGHGLGKPC
jgi:hypothetical protein